MRNLFGRLCSVSMCVCLILLCQPRCVFASSWYDGLPRNTLNWLENIAQNAPDMEAGTYSQSFDGISASVSLLEAPNGYVYAGQVNISDRGTRYYQDYDGQEKALQEIRSAVALEDMGSAVPESPAFSTSENNEDKAPLISSETPVASADKSGLRLVQNVVVPQTKTKEQKEKLAQLAGSKPKLIGGTISYEDFEYYGIDGKTYEALGGLERSYDMWDCGFYVPLSYVDVTGGDWQTAGVNLYGKRSFSFEKAELSAGLTAVLDYTFMDVEDIDNSLAYGAGPMGSITFNLKNLEIALGTSLLFMGNTEYDSVPIMASGMNVGVPIGSYFVVNGTVYRTDNLDSENDYWKLGGSVSYAVSETFDVTVGANTVTGLDNFDSTAVHLGASWRY